MDKPDGPDVMYLDGISGGFVIALFFIFAPLCFKKLAKSPIKCAEKKILEKYIKLEIITVLRIGI